MTRLDWSEVPVANSTRVKPLTQLDSIRNWNDSTRDSTFEKLDSTRDSTCRWLVATLPVSFSSFFPGYFARFYPKLVETTTNSTNAKPVNFAALAWERVFSWAVNDQYLFAWNGKCLILVSWNVICFTAMRRDCRWKFSVKWELRMSVSWTVICFVYFDLFYNSHNKHDTH
jgi:hypothetical protein